MEYNIAKIRDKIRLFEKTNKINSTNFLTPAEIQEVIEVLRGYDFYLAGGFEEAERRIIIIGTNENTISNFCTIIRIETISESPLAHRNVLGSILGLGIKREMIGDIIVNGKVCDIIIMREMKEYILNNLDKVGREKIKIREIPFEDLLSIGDNKTNENVSVASLRADAIISSAFGIAREKSADLIKQEKVLVNFVPCSNTSKSIKENDLISVRGFGRVKVVEILGETKKGRIRINIEKY